MLCWKPRGKARNTASREKVESGRGKWTVSSAHAPGPGATNGDGGFGAITIATKVPRSERRWSGVEFALASPMIKTNAVQLLVVLDESASRYSVISISAGMRGLQVFLAPTDYARVVIAKSAKVARVT